MTDSILLHTDVLYPFTEAITKSFLSEKDGNLERIEYVPNGRYHCFPMQGINTYRICIDKVEFYIHFGFNTHQSSIFGVFELCKRRNNFESYHQQEFCLLYPTLQSVLKRFVELLNDKPTSRKFCVTFDVSRSFCSLKFVVEERIR